MKSIILINNYDDDSEIINIIINSNIFCYLLEVKTQL